MKSLQAVINAANRVVYSLLAMLCVYSLAHAACATPLAGAPCPATDAAYCADGGVARSCQAGVLVDFPCPGPAGCKRTPDRTVMCDETSGAQPGTRCLPENEGHGQCAADAASYLQCANGAWTQVACQQGSRCQDIGGVACK